MKYLPGIIGIVVICIEIYRWVRGRWIRHVLEGKKKAKMLRKPAVLRPKSELDCPYCVEEKRKKANPEPKKAVVDWSERKGRGGRRKGNSTEGYFCPNVECDYFGISAEKIHALVWDGRHGKQEEIRDLKCQACRKKFTMRKNTVLYRLKTHSGLVEKIMWLLALGVDASALEEVFGVREITIRSWLWRRGVQGRKLHEQFMVELNLIHVQLDELWGHVKSDGQEVWLWAVTDVKTKLVPVLQLGGRTQAMAYRVVHELKERLRADCVPVFSTDGLRHYFYALTAHFGKWELLEGKNPVWVLLRDFMYGQVIKHQKRRRTVEVERRMQVGEGKVYRERLKAAGLSGHINTSFIERLNLTIRQNVSKLTRWTWGPTYYASEGLMEHLDWWRSYYHFVRYHESLTMKLDQAVERKGKRQPQRYRCQTPAMAAGLVMRRWSVKELLSYPLL